jgi:hypothetical protein
MQEVLIQQKCVNALKGETALSATIAQADKTEMVDKFRCVNVLLVYYSFHFKMSVVLAKKIVLK